MIADINKFLEQVFAGMLSPTAEGKRFIWGALYVAAAGVALKFLWPTLGDMLGLAPLGFAAAFAFAYFFRNPERAAVFAPDEIACPADGRVLSVKNEGQPGVTVVRIFLSVFDVHIQRATMDGDIGEVVYTKGRFAVASAPEAAQNERNLIQIKSGARYAHVEQITGAIARRIACWVKPGDAVKAGQRIGLIYFGSQAAIYLPDTARVLVKPGQKVEGGLTVLGLWNDNH
ncbi:MAG: phosphatidylserine decarboxylase [Elusimicrobiales bacterium]